MSDAKVTDADRAAAEEIRTNFYEYPCHIEAGVDLLAKCIAAAIARRMAPEREHARKVRELLDRAMQFRMLALAHPEIRADEIEAIHRLAADYDALLAAEKGEEYTQSRVDRDYTPSRMAAEKGNDDE